LRDLSEDIRLPVPISLTLIWQAKFLRLVITAKNSLTKSQEDRPIDLQAFAAQLAQQSQIVQRLLLERSQFSDPILQGEGMVATQPILHDLPVPPNYDE
jgi:hypothetical protein